MLIVKKFGGTSVADKDRIMNVAKRCIEDYKAGNDVVVVLSAMGKQTDVLIEMAKEINPNGEYIFMPRGKLMLTDTFNEHLKKYCSECNIPYYSSHKIRFTSASNLYNGKNLTQVSRALGHSQVATTLHYFRNVDCDDDLLEQMENAFKIS